MRAIRPGFLWLLALLSSFVVRCSDGDENVQFQVCLMNCIEDSCPRPLPLSLRLFWWTCEDDCKYQCMWSKNSIHSFSTLSQQQQQQPTPTMKYYGKWPFKRMIGIQEPASVLFSILNGASHLVGWRFILGSRIKERPQYWMNSCYIRYFWTGIIVWTCSAIFHSRDTWLTEKLDYFAAGWSIFMWLHLSVCRTWPIVNQLVQQRLFWLIISGYLVHVCKMLFHRFDYGYNLVVMCVIGMIGQVMWIYWTINNNKSVGNAESGEKNCQYRYLIPWIIGLFTISTAVLEVGDFPPIWDVFDSHSLWHLSTIPLTFMWYLVFADDVANGHQPLE